MQSLTKKSGKGHKNKTAILNTLKELLEKLTLSFLAEKVNQLHFVLFLNLGSLEIQP